METLRDVLALILVIGAAPTLLLWFLVHPFVGFWRRVGPWWSYGIVGGILVGVAILLARASPRLLAVDYGTDWLVVAAGCVCFVASAWLRVVLEQRVGAAFLLGLPELAPRRHPGVLRTDGPYARVRHPRYVQFVLALLGCALVANHLAAYVVAIGWLAGVHPIVWLEERELRARFGTEYDAYCRRVPRYFPRRAPTRGA